MAIGVALAYIAPRRAEHRPGAGTVAVAVCVGLFLGYQAVLVLGIVVAALGLLERAIRRVQPGAFTMGPVIWLALLVPPWLVFWRELAAMCPLTNI